MHTLRFLYEIESEFMYINISSDCNSSENTCFNITHPQKTLVLISLNDLNECKS